MKKIYLKLKERTYPIFINFPIKSLLNFLLEKKFTRKITIITDKNLLNKSRSIENVLKRKFKVNTITIPAGERSKNIKTVSMIYDQLLKFKIDRYSPIIALGGGVIGDISGFVAATFMRGVPYLQFPTTLLAMVDSAIGGKVGIDLPSGKNLIGSFYQPSAVWINTEFLNSLPKSEIKNGISEVIKYSVISDGKFFKFLNEIPKNNLSPQIFEKIIYECIRIKARIVEKDETERKGVREVLNFGHTIGHALETYSGYKFPHGEVVSIGMIVECKLAEKLLGFKEYNSVKKLIEKFGLPTKPKERIKPEEFLKLLQFDKKVRAGKLVFALPMKIGKVKIYRGAPYKEVAKAIEIWS